MEINKDCIEKMPQNITSGENKKKLYEELSEKLKNINFENIKHKFSLDDNFFLSRQEPGDIEASEDLFDQDDITSRLFRPNANEEIAKLTPYICDLGPPRKIYLNTKKENFENTNYSEEFLSNKQKETEQPNTKEKVLHQAMDQNDFKTKIKNSSEECFKKRKKDWTTIIQELKEQSSVIASNYFKSNVVLNDNIDYGITYEDRFNKGDGSFVYQAPEEIPLMQQLEEFARKNSEKSTETNDIYKLSMTDSVINEATQVVKEAQTGGKVSWRNKGNLNNGNLISTGISCNMDAIGKKIDACLTTLENATKPYKECLTKLEDRSFKIQPSSQRDNADSSFNAGHIRNNDTDEESDDDDAVKHSRQDWLRMREAAKAI